MNNLLKGPRGIISSHVEEEWFARKRMATCCQLWQVTSDRGDPISIVTPVMSWSEDLFNADHRTHGIWVVFQDMKPPKSILRKSSDMKKPIQRVKITKAIARRTKIRDQNSSIGYSEVFKNWMKRSGSRKFILLEHKIIYFFMNSYWSRDLREAHHKSQWNGRIDDISVFYIRHHCKKNIGRRSRYYPWTYWQDTGFAKWNELYEWFEKFSRLEDVGNEEETSEMLLNTNVLVSASRSKVEAKPQRRISARSTTNFYLLGEKIWTDIQPQDYSPTDYSLSTKLIILLCHGCLPREDDGSFEFLRMNDNLQKHVQHRHRWADEKWRTEWEEEEDKKKISVLSRFFRNNSVFPGSPRSFWTQPYESFITVIILDGIFEFFNHVGYAINLHSIINSRLIPGRQILSNRQTVFFLFVDPLDKEHKHLDTIELEAPRLAHPCGKHGRDIRILCIGRHQHCSEERIEVSDTIERHHPLRNTSSLLYPESCSDGNLRSRERKSFCVTSSSSKDFFATWLDEIIGFRSCSTNRWTSCSTIHKNTTKPTKLNPKSW